ncbi:MAG: hypothetical protein QXL47_01205 [Candidatus Anstonellales archaeon]
MRMQSLEQKNHKNRIVERVLNDPEEYKTRLESLISYLNNEREILTILSLESNGLIEEIQKSERYKSRYRVLPLTGENREHARRILLRYFNNVFRDVLKEEKSHGLEDEARDRVAGFFAEIMLKERKGLDIFNPFVLELYNAWQGHGELGLSTIYGVVSKPTFMGEMLARFVLEGKAEKRGIDFTDKNFPLKEEVAREYFGKLWKQKMLFLEMLQMLRTEQKISYTIIEKFVDKTFAKSKNRAFIIKAFVEMAKNRGFELSQVSDTMHKKIDNFIKDISCNKFNEEITNTEIMQGVEGFSWSMRYQKKAYPASSGKTITREKKMSEKATMGLDETKKKKLTMREVSASNPEPKKHRTDDKRRHVKEKAEPFSASTRYHFVQLVNAIKSKGKNEISLPELFKLMEELGYRRTVNAHYSVKVFSGTVIKKVIRFLDSRRIIVTHAHALTPEEKEDIKEFAKTICKEEGGKKTVQFRKIYSRVVEGGRFAVGYLRSAIKEACTLLYVEGYMIKDVPSSLVSGMVESLNEQLKKTKMAKGEQKKLLATVIDSIYRDRKKKIEIKEKFGIL